MIKSIKPEYAFIFFSIIFGFILIFFTPPFQSPDEPAHFAKTVSFAQGHFLSKKINDVSGDNLPASILAFEKYYEDLFFNTSGRTSFEKINESKKVKFDEKNKTFVNQKYHAMYSPIAYAPQGVGVLVFKYFTDSVYFIMIGGKIFLLFFYTIMGYFSIKSIPFCKWLCTMILLMPMSLSLGASISADGVLIAVSILFFAKIIQYSYQQELLSKAQIITICVFAVCLSLIKQSFLIALFVLFIPKNKFTSNYISKIMLILLPALAVSLLWSKFSYTLFIPMHGANPTEQVQFILSHPIVYLITLSKTLCAYFFSLIYSTIGVLGWLDVFLLPCVYWLYVCVLFINTFYQADCHASNFNSSLFQKILLSVLVVINFVVICTIIYVSWSVPYLISYFEGLQGRYFIPLLLPLFTFLFLLFNKKLSGKNSWVVKMNLVFIILVYTNIFFGLYIRYYANF